jgi:hypothetical protein
MICEEIFTIKEETHALWMLYDHSDEDSCPPKRNNILWPNREFWSEPVFLDVGPGIDSKEWIPPAHVAWRAGTTNLSIFGS